MGKIALLPNTLLLVAGVLRLVVVLVGDTFPLNRSRPVSSLPRLPFLPPRFGGFLRFNTSLKRLADKNYAVFSFILQLSKEFYTSTN